MLMLLLSDILRAIEVNMFNALLGVGRLPRSINTPKRYTLTYSNTGLASDTFNEVSSQIGNNEQCVACSFNIKSDSTGGTMEDGAFFEVWVDGVQVARYVLPTTGGWGYQITDVVPVSIPYLTQNSNLIVRFGPLVPPDVTGYNIGFAVTLFTIER